MRSRSGLWQVTNMRWNVLLCVAIVGIAIAFAAAVVFLASPAGGSGSGSATLTKTLTIPKHKVLSNLSAVAMPRQITGMTPSDPNMTVIAKTGGKLLYNTTTVSVDVTNPPLLIDLTIVPKLVSETKWYVNRTLNKREEIVQVPVMSKNAFVNLSVVDRETGKIVARDGFGKTDSTDQHRSLRVYEPGTYDVSLYGNEVTVDALVSMRTPGFTF